MAGRTRFRDLSEARETLSEAELRFEHRRRSIGFVVGPLAFVLLLLLPMDLPRPPARLLAVLAWVLTWWLTEAVPIPVTALLGPALGALCGVGTAKQMFGTLGDPIIFLFLGSFILAEGMSTSGLDRRMAFAILARPWVGSSAGRIHVTFAVIVAVLSMWLSNTATTAMMYPIAMSILTELVQLLGGEQDFTRLRYGTSLMLTTAYAASIGGIATPVGSPPNLIAIGQLRALAGIELPFFQWMLLTTPLMLLMLALLVLYMRRALPPEAEQITGSAEHVAAQRRALGPWTAAQRNALLAFGVTVALWVLPGVLALILGQEAELCRALKNQLPEAAAAVVGAVLLFVLPVDWKQRRFTLTWNQAVNIDWGTLLLFGGGLSLGGAMFRTGLARSIGTTLVRVTGARSPWALTYLFAGVSLVLTETTSNTAAATMVCPLAIAAARAAHLSPVAPTVATALAASMAFLLPVSTPPNAIIYGSGCVPITAMLRHGAVLDLAVMAIMPAGVMLISRALGI